MNLNLGAEGAVPGDSARFQGEERLSPCQHAVLGQGLLGRILD